MWAALSIVPPAKTDREVEDHEHPELRHDLPRSPIEHRVVGAGPGEHDAHQAEDRTRGPDGRTGARR